jgi:hypothetical protein
MGLMQRIQQENIARETAIRRALKSLAIQWAEAQDDNERLQCDRQANEYIDSSLKKRSSCYMGRMNYAVLYVDEKLRLRREIRLGKDAAAAMPFQIHEDIEFARVSAAY